MSTDPKSTRPMLNDSDAPSAIAPDAIHPQVDGTHVKGIDPQHPELAQSHRDNVAARVADLSDETSTGHDSSNPVVIEEHALWSTAPSRVIEHGIPGEDE